MKKIFTLSALCLLTVLSQNVKAHENSAAAGEKTLSGVFAVGTDKWVIFSQGNLQFNAEKDVMRFADNQYDTVGVSNSHIALHYDGWIDLFGWGTGDNPSNGSTWMSDYSGFTDWGTHPISNGGSNPDPWRTLTAEEWNYLFFSRSNAEVKFAFGSVNGVNGLIILPENWTLPEGSIFTPSTEQGLVAKEGYYLNSDKDNFTHNTYSVKKWAPMEEAGAVFLPAAGYRWSVNASDANVHGKYWSATASVSDDAKAVCMYFHNERFYPNADWTIPGGLSVRLVHETIYEGIEEVSGSAAKAQKLFVDGQLYIIRPDGQCVDMRGARVR